MDAIKHLNNRELIFFEIAFLVILITEQENRGQNAFFKLINMDEEIEKLATFIGNFIFTYKEFINPNAIVMANEDMANCRLKISDLSKIERIALLNDEYDKFKSVLLEHIEKDDLYATSFLDVGDDVFAYTTNLVNQPIISKRDHEQKFTNWLRMLSDGMM